MITENFCMNFGNWTVTDATIDWNGESDEQYNIEAADLPETIEGDDGVNMYQALLLPLQEEFISFDDLVDLSYAFVYAFAASEHDFDYEIFDQTLAYQASLFEDDEDDEDEED